MSVWMIVTSDVWVASWSFTSCQDVATIHHIVPYVTVLSGCVLLWPQATLLPQISHFPAGVLFPVIFCHRKAAAMTYRDWKKTGDNLKKGKRRGKSVELQRQEKRKQLTMEYFKASEAREEESNSQEQWRNRICSKEHHVTSPPFLSNATFFLLFFSVSSARFVRCNSGFIHLHVAQQKGK